MEIVNQLDHCMWKDFVENHPKGNIFHTPEMFEVYNRGKGYHPSLWAIVEGDRILALHLPVQITLIGGPFRYLTTRDVDFGGVLVEDSEQGRRGLMVLLQEYNRRIPGMPLFTELRNFADQCYIMQALEKYGYTFEDHLDYLLDLRRDSDKILQSFTKSTRNRIRKILRDGNMIVKEVTDINTLPLFYEQLKKTFRAVRVPLADFSLFEAAFNILRPKNMAYFAIAYVNGTPAAAQVSIIFKDIVFGWYNGIDRAFKYCNDFLIWDVIKWGADCGYDVLDFGGAGKPGEDYGVRDFKSKFNGELVNFGRNTRVNAPIRMKVCETAYQLARGGLFALNRLRLGSSDSI